MKNIIKAINKIIVTGQFFFENVILEHQIWENDVWEVFAKTIFGNKSYCKN